MKNIEEKFSNTVWQPNTIALFRKVLYVFLAFQALSLLPSASAFWGPDAFLPYYYQVKTPLLQLLNPLQTGTFKNYYLFFPAAQLVFIILSFVIRPQRVLCILIYFFTAALHHKAAIIQNSGNDLALIMVFYLIFMSEKSSHPLNNTLTNFSFLAAKLQVAFVYLVAGISKLRGEHWIDGTALYYVFNADEYSCWFAKHYLASSSFVVYTGTYLKLGLQLVFPLFIWFKRTKKLTMLLGIVIHVLIIFLMGLTDFGLIMIIVYALFLSDETSTRVLKKFSWTRYSGSFQGL